MTISHDLDLPALGRWGCDRVSDSLFWSVSGSHLYGFPSADSDIDLRGCFRAPLREIAGLRPVAETIEPKGTIGGREVEAVSHEIGKYLRLLCKHNGYVLEQIFSPLVAHGSAMLEELRPVAKKCITHGCYNHYRGFLHTQRKMFEQQDIKRVKTLLYAYRVVLTGIHLLDTGEVVAHLPTLNERFQLPFIADLIDRKGIAELNVLSDVDVSFHRNQLAALEKRMDVAFMGSKLPAEAPIEELDRLLINWREIE
jgi:predicted nucleotidyltransferase